ncbi:MAG TPA: uroporphyrinogen decarboxylase family protein [Clostridia bacterium]|nr:uroporphyrinogen decarboxylase family protein [Clostridia bacterium]
MKSDMRKWINEIAESAERLAMPIMTYPGLELINKTVSDIIGNGDDQFLCMQALANKYPSIAAATVMDLSVEAEVFGSSIRFSTTEVPTVTGNIVDGADSARKLSVPEIGEGRTYIYIKAAELAARNISDRPVFGGEIGPFSLACRLFDMTELMVLLYDEPETVHTVLEKAASFLVEYAKAFKNAGANGIIIAEPAAGLLSPEHCTEFSSTYVKRIVDAVQDRHFIVILHNCGNTAKLVPSLLSAGAWGLHFGNAVDMSDILPQIPKDRIAFGNISPAAVFRHGTVEDVRHETMRLLEKTSQYGNFVISSGCDIPPGTPVGNIDAFFDSLRKYNKAFTPDSQSHAASICLHGRFPSDCGYR